MPNILTSLVGDRIKSNPAETVFFTYKNNRWEPRSWEKFGDDVLNAAAALEILGVEVGERTGIFSSNRPGCLLADFASYALRAVPVSMYATSSADQIAYIVNDASIKVLMVGSTSQLLTVLSVKDQCPSLHTIVGLSTTIEKPATGAEMFISYNDFLDLGRHASPQCRESVGKRTTEATEDDVATLIYTSGTTGEPKGAILTHSCFNACLETHRRWLTGIDENDTSLCFLPLSHIFEKAWTYFCLYRGIKVYINTDPREVQRAICQVRPTCMCSVPRFWEKVYTAIQEKIAMMSPLQRLVVKRALVVGRKRNLKYKRMGLKVPAWLEKRYQFYDRHVFSLMKKAAGIDRGRMFPTAGAPLSSKIVEFFQAAGINVMIGYGLSETCATVTAYPYVGWELGTVGTPIESAQVKIGDQNEILVKGPTVMKGYFNKPAETEAAFTADGWLRTGDAGYIDEHGAVVLTERIKDLFKTSNGKYIAPQALESCLGADPYIEQVAVIADDRKYVTALITPAFEAIKEYARKKKIQYRNMEDLVRNTDIRALIQERIDRLQRSFAPFEKIKKFTLIPREFTMEKGELTNTLKIRRRIINEHFAPEIEAMYA